MFRKLIDWNRARREWNARHLEAWQGASVHGPDGLSPFQHRCEARLARDLDVAGFSLVERVVEMVPEHEFVRARVSGTPICVWIHDDIAGYDYSGGGQRFEEWDYASPDELIADFCVHAIRAAQMGE